jgi:tetratricopeptide (TPR) repeat protein
LFFTACSRQAATVPEERVAILRFENLGANPALDWIGRALSESIADRLAGRPGLYSISSGTLHGLARATGPRPSVAPGISAESSLALLAGANRVGYGEFAVRRGRLEATLFLEDVPARKYDKVISASGAVSDVAGVANSLARQIAPLAVGGMAPNGQALQDYVNAIEGKVPEDIQLNAAAAIAADPGFTPAYRLLAERKAQQRDMAGALELLDQAAKRASSPIERARIHLQLAGLSNDAIDRRRALAELATADPGNPEQWRILADALYAAHADAEAAAAFRKLLALEPDNKAALNSLGYASANAGDLPAAVAALERYRTLAPGDPNPTDSLGDVYLMTGHLPEAEELYLSAYRKNPKFLDGADLFKAAMARLMTGDIPGATEIHETYVKALAGNPAHHVEVERGEWTWAIGRRHEAYQQMLANARSLETGTDREAAAHCYADLAMWSLFLGDRAAAAQMAQKAMTVSGAQLSAAAVVARFLAQPPATPAEWTDRAGKLFPNPTLKPIRDVALVSALLLDKQYQPASEILRKLYDDGTHTPVDEGIPVLLAWTLLETGRYPDAAALLHTNPIPPATGFTVFTTLYFPRFFYLRGVLAEKTGKTQEARDAYKLFLQLSGPDALGWGEEKKAKP